MKILIIFFILIVVLFIPDVYVYRSYILHTVSHSWIYWIPQLIVILAIIICIFDTNPSTQFRHLGFASFALLCLQLPKTIFFIIDIIGKLCSFIGCNQKIFSIIGICCGSIVLLTLLYGCFIELYRFDVRHVTYKNEKIPTKFNNYKIILFSDLHCGSWNPNGKQMKKLIHKINDQHPDLILFAGDLVTNNHTEVDPFFNELRQLQATDGIISILGNHDYSFINSSRDTLQKLIEKEKNLGWHLLLNEHRIISRAEDSIAIIGVENAGKPPFPHRAELSKAQNGTEKLFRILLSHDPSHWREEIIPQSDIPLTLSGHTHAGQLDLPFLSLSKSLYPEYRGIYSIENQSIYVSAGAGFTFLPIRIGARPEVTVIELKNN